MAESITVASVIDRAACVITRLVFMQQITEYSVDRAVATLQSTQAHTRYDARLFNEAMECVRDLPYHILPEWIEDHQAFLTKCLTPKVAYLVPVDEYYDFTSLDIFAPALIGQYAAPLTGDAAENIASLCAVLRGNSVYISRMLATHLYLHLLTNPAFGLHTVPRSAYLACVTTSAVAFRVAVKQSVKRTSSFAGSSNKIVRSETISPGPEPDARIRYVTEPDHIVGTPLKYCVMLGNYIAVPTAGPSVTIKFDNIMSKLEQVQSPPTELRPGDYYLLSPDSIGVVYQIVAVRPSVDLDETPQISIKK